MTCKRQAGKGWYSLILMMAVCWSALTVQARGEQQPALTQAEADKYLSQSLSYFRRNCRPPQDNAVECDSAHSLIIYVYLMRGEYQSAQKQIYAHDVIRMDDYLGCDNLNWGRSESGNIFNVSKWSFISITNFKLGENKNVRENQYIYGFICSAIFRMGSGVKPNDEVAITKEDFIRLSPKYISKKKSEEMRNFDREIASFFSESMYKMMFENNSSGSFDQRNRETEKMYSRIIELSKNAKRQTEIRGYSKMYRDIFDSIIASDRQALETIQKIRRD